jgi:hypothetical protein
MININMEDIIIKQYNNIKRKHEELDDCNAELIMEAEKILKIRAEEEQKRIDIMDKNALLADNVMANYSNYCKIVDDCNINIEKFRRMKFSAEREISLLQNICPHIRKNNKTGHIYELGEKFNCCAGMTCTICNYQGCVCRICDAY